ncbi:MAG: Rpn family recombination-promoting nuclease/putative transposase [bacterium]
MLRVMTPTPHDASSSAFGDPQHAAGELQAILPSALVARLDFAGLRVEPGSFVDEELEPTSCRPALRGALPG